MKIFIAFAWFNSWKSIDPYLQMCNQVGCGFLVSSNLCITVLAFAFERTLWVHWNVTKFQKDLVGSWHDDIVQSLIKLITNQTTHHMRIIQTHFIHTKLLVSKIQVQSIQWNKIYCGCEQCNDFRAYEECMTFPRTFITSQNSWINSRQGKKVLQVTDQRLNYLLSQEFSRLS